MISRRSFVRAGLATAGLVAAGTSLTSGPAASARPGVRRPTAGWDRLDRCLTGDLVRPGDPDYPQAKQLDNGYFDSVSPQAVAYCENERDVAACLAFAQHHDVPLAIRSGGHSAAGYSTGTGLVLDVSRLRRIDVGAGTVTIGPGTQGVDLLDTLAPLGRAAVTGTCPTVCAGGYLSGGGIGPLARRFGVASDGLVAARVVLADGSVRSVSARRDPDLFWALRGGGGGNFGVVTEYRMRTTETARMTSFSLLWSWADAAEVLAAYLRWLPRTPQDVTANLTVASQGPGTTPSVSVTGGWLGPDPTGIEPHLAGLVAAVGAAPTVRLVQDLTYQQALMRQYGCSDKTVDQCHRVGYNPEAALARHGYVVARGRLLDRTPDTSAIAAALALFDRDPLPGQFRILSLGGLGGRINRPGRRDTAYVHRSSDHYLTFTSGVPGFTPTPQQRAAVGSWTGDGFAIARRHGTEGQVNFIDPMLPDWRRAYYAENYDRLVGIKRRYDPHRFFRFAQAIGS
ncbi:FAD-binding oxidoreductase [Plantactinospora sp. KBS50]|uniref:FAD-binding oxidoreductase n=1 Tax=Plantactinospora sp. KBS50 TaxID=2024580 RepID=UPI0018DFB8E5|nr:FAD-dependent oxidoreductase [Plantactinospora sp. KBS50]